MSQEVIISKGELASYLKNLSDKDFITGYIRLVCSIYYVKKNQKDKYLIDCKFSEMEELNKLIGDNKLQLDYYSVNDLLKFGIKFNESDLYCNNITSIDKPLFFCCDKNTALDKDACKRFYDDFISNNFEGISNCRDIYYYVYDLEIDYSNMYRSTVEFDTCYNNILSAVKDRCLDTLVNSLKVTNCVKLPYDFHAIKNFSSSWNNFLSIVKSNNLVPVDTTDIVNTYYTRIINNKGVEDVVVIFKEFLEKINKLGESEYVKNNMSTLIYNPFATIDSTESNSLRNKFFYLSCMYLRNSKLSKIDFIPYGVNSDIVIRDYCYLNLYNRLPTDIMKTYLNIPVLFGYQVNNNVCLMVSTKAERKINYRLMCCELDKLFDDDVKTELINVYVDDNNFNSFDSLVSLDTDIKSKDKDKAIRADMNIKKHLARLRELVGGNEYLTVFNTVIFERDNCKYICKVDNIDCNFTCYCNSPFLRQDYWNCCEVKIELENILSFNYFREFINGKFLSTLLVLLNYRNKASTELVNIIADKKTNSFIKGFNTNLDINFFIDEREFIFRMINSCNMYRSLSNIKDNFTYYEFGSGSSRSRSFCSEYIPYISKLFNLNIFKNEVFSSLGGLNQINLKDSIIVDCSMI